MKIFCRHTVSLCVFIVILFAARNVFAQPSRFNVDSIKALVRQLSTDTGQVKAYIDMASVMYCVDSTSKILIANEAKMLAERIKWDEGIYKSNRKLGEIYFTCLKNYDKAFAAFEANVTYATAQNDTLNLAKALETIAKKYQRIPQYHKALEYYNRVFAVMPGVDMQIGVLGDMGVVYTTIGDYNNALMSYKSSLRMMDSVAKVRNNQKDIHDTLQMAGLQLNIGEIYLAMKELDKALQYYDTVWQTSIAIKDPFFQIASLTGIGETFKLKGNAQKAIDNYQLALHKCREINEFREEAKILNALANTYLSTDKYATALLYADTSLRLAEDQSYTDLLPRSYITLGNIYAKQNKYDYAIPSLQKALSIAQTTNELEDEKDAWFALKNAYNGNGQYKEAYEAYEHFIAISDSIYNIEKHYAVIKKDLEYDFKTRHKIDSVYQKEIYDKTIERQKRITYTGLGGLILVILLTFFIYRSYNIQKKYNELLSKEKKGHLAHIEAQSNVLSDIAHTQAHHVRGPIATILGLVKLYNMDDPADPLNKEVIEGLNIVTERLDTVVKDVIAKENDLRFGKDTDDNV